MKHTFLFTLLIALGAQQIAKAQDNRRVVVTGVPFLMISADARASGLGDQGIATKADAFSQQWNPAKYVFSEAQQGVALSYTPYLREIADDINLAQLTYFNRFNERSSVSASLRYFGMGGVELRRLLLKCQERLNLTSLHLMLATLCV